MSTTNELSSERLQAYAGMLITSFTGGIVSLAIDLGHRAGLFEALARGAASSTELSARAALDERSVREWLATMVTSGVIEYEADLRRYVLPPEGILCLTGGSAANLAPVARVVAELGNHVPAVVDAFGTGEGVPYETYRPGFTDLMDGASRFRFDELLVEGYLAAVDGLNDRLAGGLDVADIGCGTGHAVNVMASAFPSSRFTGYDISADAIVKARDEAETLQLSNARFQVADVAHLPGTGFDLITAFDCIHDQANPAAVLARVHDALAPEGVFLMVDVAAQSELHDNIGNPLAPYFYGISTFHCLQVSLAERGAALGAMWGEELARKMLADAGFRSVALLPAPLGDPVNCIYVCSGASDRLA